MSRTGMNIFTVGGVTITGLAKRPRGRPCRVQDNTIAHYTSLIATAGIKVSSAWCILALGR